MITIAATIGSDQRSYPYLGKNRRTGEVVLFWAAGAGVRLHSGESGAADAVKYMAVWQEQSFDPWRGEITIKGEM